MILQDVKLTQEQLDALAPYAHEFKRAIDSNFCKAPTQPELKKIREIYVAATGVKAYPANFGCTYCVIQLMKDAGRLYAAALDLKAIEALEKVAPDDPLAAGLKVAHEGLVKLKEGADAGALAKELEANFVPDSANTLIPVTETAQISTQKPKTGEGTAAKKPAKKTKK